jgi:hypothetical protein
MKMILGERKNDNIGVMEADGSSGFMDPLGVGGEGTRKEI